jgi:hypothetical protein
LRSQSDTRPTLFSLCLAIGDTTASSCMSPKLHPQSGTPALLFLFVTCRLPPYSEAPHVTVLLLLLLDRAIPSRATGKFMDGAAHGGSLFPTLKFAPRLSPSHHSLPLSPKPTTFPLSLLVRHAVAIVFL